MKDGPDTGEPARFGRQDVFRDYRQWCLQLGPDVQPCRDERLLAKAAEFLLRQPDLRDAFTVFPFLQAVTQTRAEPNPDRRRQLSGFIRASEMLETICVNLVVQPWKREIQSLKTFTGPFVYRLLPVLSPATIQSVLASIGYLPHDDAAQREFRLAADVGADRAMLVGFELLLARVECLRLLDVLVTDQLGPQDWSELLQRRQTSIKRTEKKKTAPQEDKEDQKKTEPQEDQKKTAPQEDQKKTAPQEDQKKTAPQEDQKKTAPQEDQKKTAPQEDQKKTAPQEDQKKTAPQEDQKKTAPVKDEDLPCLERKPKPWCHLISVDQSIMEMQKTYPDLAFRGRPLIPDQPARAQGAAAGGGAEDGGGEAEEVFDDVAAVKEGSGVGGAAPTHPVDDGLSGPRAFSLHITLRTGSEAEPGPKPRKPRSSEEAAAETQQETGRLNERAVSLSRLDGDEELAERMEQLRVLGNIGQGKGKEDDEGGEEDVRAERSQKERKLSSESRSRGKSQDGGDGVQPAGEGPDGDGAERQEAGSRNIKTKTSSDQSVRF